MTSAAPLYMALPANEWHEYSDANKPAQRRQSGLKTWESWVLKVQQTEARSKELRVSFQEFLLNMHKSFYFW